MKKNKFKKLGSNIDARNARKLSFSAGLDELRRAREFFVANDTHRREQFRYREVAGPEGSPCTRTVLGLDLSVEALGEIKGCLSETKELRTVLDAALLSAFTNESPVERGFGNFVLLVCCVVSFVSFSKTHLFRWFLRVDETVSDEENRELN